ncbi:MAG: hypothetical protein K8S13_06515 [Desulfobacula sp.]|uniref:hypothetical protein n=1 Tax=Desulfobacula sp. TaxID=2593537 RepID=UPI0025BF438B|nr:hypothetical protein [Desulfobacula sp.]MCD4719498.1 hypothetical protein [Desulfobacula sp.]
MMTRLGIYSLLAGFFLGIFAGISGFMESKNFWVELTISKMIGEDRSEAIIELIDVAVIQNSVDFLIYELPFFCFLLGLGLILLIISLFEKSH